jgi:signal peptidase I
VATAKKAKPKPQPSPRPKNVVAAVRSGKGGGRSSRALWENVKGILGALVIFLFLRTFFIEAYRIPSGSMIPSLLVGDWLFVNKLVYGPHIPFTGINLPGYREPQRWDIVVFVSPPQVDQPEDPTPTLVKRIVGMPGDTLYMRDARLFVNGVEQTQGYGSQSTYDDPAAPNEVSPLFDWQHRIELRDSRFGPPPNPPTHDNWGPLLIPPRYFFMMGDSRYNSKDSRYWGIVPRENIRGRPMFVYYSWNADDSDRPLPFITDIRWGRIFHRIR